MNTAAKVARAIDLNERTRCEECTYDSRAPITPGVSKCLYCKEIAPTSVTRTSRSEYAELDRIAQWLTDLANKIHTGTIHVVERVKILNGAPLATSVPQVVCYLKERQGDKTVYTLHPSDAHLKGRIVA